MKDNKNKQNFRNSNNFIENAFFADGKHFVSYRGGEEFEMNH